MPRAKKASFVGVAGVLSAPLPTSREKKPYWDEARQRWRFQVRLPNGTFKYIRTKYGKDEYDKAEEQQRETQRLLDAEAAAAIQPLPEAHAQAGALHTVFSYSKAFLEKRGSSHDHDEMRLRLHVFPHIGALPLRKVEPRHILNMVDKLRKAKLAPRTIRNVYSVVSALFREAGIAGLVSGTPCILKQGVHLPAVRDKDPLWRARNSYSLDEVETLISPHPYIEVDSMVGYAILALTGMRLGELSRLRVKDYEPMWYGMGGSSRDRVQSRVLGRFIVYDTKTGDPRNVPIHPELASVINAWLQWGWEKYVGRKPTSEDPVIPRVVGEDARQEEGNLRSLDTFKDRMRTHREALGWRAGRSLHTLRHTFISIAQNHGADGVTLKRATHKVPSDVWNNYTRIEWSKLCEEVLKVPVVRKVRHGVLGTWDRLDFIFPAPKTDDIQGPGRKKRGRYTKGQQPTDRFGNPVHRGYKGPPAGNAVQEGVTPITPKSPRKTRTTPERGP